MPTWTDIAGANSLSLTIPANQIANGDQFRLVATNPTDIVNSDVITITDNDAPFVAMTPNSVSYPNTQALVLGTIVNNLPGATYQWSKTPLIANPGPLVNIPGATGSTYSVPIVLTNHSDIYQVRATNDNVNFYVDSGAITAYSNITISSNPQNVSATNGQIVAFTAIAYPANLTVQWQYSDDTGLSWNNVVGGTVTTVFTDFAGIPSTTSLSNTKSTYTLTATNDISGRKLQCVFKDATNTMSATTSAATLLCTVIIPPAIVIQPIATTVAAPNPVTFSTGASGNPAPTYSWEISANLGNSWTPLGSTSSTVTFTSSVSMDGYLIRAKAHNAGGTATTNSVILTVTDPPNAVPVITQQPVGFECTINVGFDISAQATMFPIPDPIVSAGNWQRSTNNGASWTDISSTQITNTLSNATTITSNLHTINFTTNPVSYRCTFTNNQGFKVTNSAIVTATIPNIPVILWIIPSNINAANNGQNVTLTVDAVGVLPLTYQWQRRLSNIGNWLDINGANSATYTFLYAAPIVGNVWYAYRCKVTNPNAPNGVFSSAVI